ncbi:MAG: acetoin dehydrogenase dihydrolipoyllysine-residue acetyltransferase subunit [Gammaproteobacteria bacterium]
MGDKIQAIVMPKWGLAMQEGTLTDWLVEEGAEIKPGMEICDIETSKIASAMESTLGGKLQRRVAEPGVTLPVGALLGVVTDGAVADAEIDAFVGKFQEEFATAAAQAATEAPKSQTVHVGDTAINYLKLGDGGVPIVFVHGFGGDLNNWMFNQPVLAGKRATYALDLPGHGASGKAVKDGSLAGLTQLLAGFMDALKIDKAHLVGHSLGGAIIAQLAIEQPAKAASLTLVSSAGLGPEINMDYIDGFIAGSSRRDMKPVLEKLFANTELVSRDMVNDILKFKRLDGVDAALKTIAGAVFANGKQGTVLKDKLAGVTIPVQAIVGAKDQIIPAAHSQNLGGNVKVHRLADAGHMPHMEAVGEVNKLIDAIAK